MKSQYFEYGSCELILGPMFSGKTTKLTSELTECADIGLKCLYINHATDTRTTTEYHSDVATSHSSQFKGLSNKINFCSAYVLKGIDVDGYDVIGIDEGQFYDDLVEYVRLWVLEKNKRVIIASLDGTFEMKPFGHAHELICICDPGNVVKLGARCKRCMVEEKPMRHFRLVDAGFTAKKKVGNTDKTIEVGGSELYEAVCMKCHKDYYSH